MNEMTISKVLSANDVGETGAHQAGLLIPKRPDVLRFFPVLDSRTKNPRVHLLFQDDSGTRWVFAFIYYNNRFFGGTRNECRLTRMTRYMREARLVSGDTVILCRAVTGSFSVSYRRQCDQRNATNSPGRSVLRLGNQWTVINL